MKVVVMLKNVVSGENDEFFIVESNTVEEAKEIAAKHLFPTVAEGMDISFDEFEKWTFSNAGFAGYGTNDPGCRISAGIPTTILE